MSVCCVTERIVGPVSACRVTLTPTGGHPQSQIVRLNNRETTLPKSERGKLLRFFLNQSLGVVDCLFGVWLKVLG